jgi:hypothetical protein
MASTTPGIREAPTPAVTVVLIKSLLFKFFMDRNYD